MSRHEITKKIINDFDNKNIKLLDPKGNNDDVSAKMKKSMSIKNLIKEIKNDWKLHEKEIARDKEEALGKVLSWKFTQFLLNIVLIYSIILPIALTILVVLEITR